MKHIKAFVNWDQNELIEKHITNLFYTCGFERLIINMDGSVSRKIKLNYVFLVILMLQFKIFQLC